MMPCQKPGFEARPCTTIQKLGNHSKKAEWSALLQQVSCNQQLTIPRQPNKSGILENCTQKKPYLLVSVCLTCCHGGDTEMRHKCYARQCFTPKAQSTNGLQVLVLPQLRCRVSFTKEWQIFILKDDEHLITRTCCATT